MSRPITVTNIDYGPTEAADEHRFPPTLFSHIDKEINDNVLNGDIMEKKNATVLFQSKKALMPNLQRSELAVRTIAPTVLHLSTHGVHIQRHTSCEANTVWKWLEQQKNPMLRSFIAMSGANTFINMPLDPFPSSNHNIFVLAQFHSK